MSLDVFRGGGEEKKTRPFYEHCGIDWVKVDEYFLEK